MSKLLSRSEINEIKSDIEWAMSGKGDGWIEAKDALALINTMEVMAETIKETYEELLRD